MEKRVAGYALLQFLSQTNRLHKLATNNKLRTAAYQYFHRTNCIYKLLAKDSFSAI